MADSAARYAVRVPIGYRVGGWEVTGRIATGSWGSVYAGQRVAPPRAPTDPPEGLPVALKFLPSGTLTPLQYANLLQIVDREIRFSALADHPRLIRTFETLVVDDPDEPALSGAVVLVMERAARSLRDLLDAADHPVPDAARLVSEIGEGLAHMHALGWVHGDLKPSNVLLMDDRSVRLADFGLTGELEGTHAYTPRVGSSDYLAPEWWTERISERGIASRTTGDIWAFGVTAHLLLTGGLYPFPGATARARAAAAQRYADGDAELRLAEELPEAWRQLIADCLAPDHDSRARHTAAEVVARIHALRSGGSDPASHASGRRHLSRRVWSIAALAALAVTATAVTLILLPPAGAPCPAQQETHADYRGRTFPTRYNCSTAAGSAVYANVAAGDHEPLDDTGYMRQAPTVWVICQRQGRANPVIGGDTSTWWLYTQSDVSRPNTYGYAHAWGYLPANVVTQAAQGEPIPDLPVCPVSY
jgi:serine/threonine protein kinase